MSVKSLFLAGFSWAGAAANLAWFSPEVRHILPEPLKYHAGDFSFGAVIAVGAVSTYELVRRRFGEPAGLAAMGTVLATGIGLMVANEGFGLGGGAPAWPDLHAAAVGLATGTLIIHNLRDRFAALPPSRTRRLLQTTGILAVQH